MNTPKSAHDCHTAAEWHAYCQSKPRKTKQMEDLQRLILTPQRTTWRDFGFLLWFLAGLITGLGVACLVSL